MGGGDAQSIYGRHSPGRSMVSHRFLQIFAKNRSDFADVNAANTHFMLDSPASAPLARTLKGDKPMISVETLIAEDGLVQTMETMRTWLDHMRFAPATFRYTFVTRGIIMRVDFSVEDEARVFSQAFNGKLVARQLDAVL